MRLQKNGIKINETGIGLLIGDIVYYIIGEMVILLFMNNKLHISIGFLLGFLLSVFMTLSMSISVEKAIRYKISEIIRYFVVAEVLIIVGITEIGNIVASLFGLMALKFSAYICPFTDKIIKKNKTLTRKLKYDNLENDQ